MMFKNGEIIKNPNIEAYEEKFDITYQNAFKFLLKCDIVEKTCARNVRVFITNNETDAPPIEITGLCTPPQLKAMGVDAVDMVKMEDVDTFEIRVSGDE